MFGTGAIAYAKLGGSKPAGSNVPPPVEKDTSIQATSKEEEDLWVNRNGSGQSRRLCAELDLDQEIRELINSIRQFVSEAEGDKKH